MKTMFSRLLGSRSRSRRAATRPIRRATPLRLEALDDRSMPSVTATVDGSQLFVSGDSGNDNISVTSTVQIRGLSAIPIVRVTANFFDGSSSKSWEGIKSLVLWSGGGVDSITNDTSLPSRFNGAGGQVTMTGGTGKNVFVTDGNDRVIPKGSNNVTFGLVSDLKSDNLQAEGSLAAQMTNNMLTLTGPGGAGFRIGGKWTSDGAANPTFTASGNMTLKTALGDIPFVVSSAAPLTVRTSQVEGMIKAGVVTGVSLTGLPDLSLNGSGPLKALSNTLGLGVSLPNVSWGLKLGSDLDDMNLPVNNGVPYLYAKLNTGFSVSFGGASVSTSGTSMALAVDPSDPYVGFSYNDIAVAASAKGRIAFTPVAQPTAISETLYGNLYGAGAVDLGAYPIQISGGAVIDLDANDDGTFAGLSGDTFKRLIKGQLKVTDMAANVVNDIAIGVNGTVSLSFDKAGFNFNVPVANATLMYEPGIVAFRGDQPNIFAGTPIDSLLPKALQDFISPPRYFVDGSVSWAGANTDWHLTAGVDNLVLGGSFRATHAQVTLDNNGVHADASISGLLGMATIHATGDINTNGSFSLAVNAGASFTIPKVTTIHGNLNFELKHEANSSTTLSAHLTGAVDPFSIVVGDVGGSIDAGIDFKAVSIVVGNFKSYTISASGHGTASLTFKPSGSSTQTYSIGFSANSSGFTIVTPSPLPNLSVSWNGVVYYDVNNDGVRDPNEPGLSGYKVYLDLNENGRLDRNEPTAISDATGSYAFSQLPVRPVTARIVLPTRNVALTDEFDNDVFDPNGDHNMQYHFGLHEVNPLGRQELATALRRNLSKQTAGIGFWGGAKGQALIKSLNGGPTSTQLGDWLAATLPNLYGPLASKTNADVGAQFQLLRVKGRMLDAQVMATALSVYITDSTLAGDAASAYGFKPVAGGAGAMSFNIGVNGLAANAANNSVISILDILRATDAASAGGVLYGGAVKARGQASALYIAINLAGGI